MNGIAAIAIAAFVVLTVVLTGLTGITRIPSEGYAGLSLLLGGLAVTGWGREEQETAARVGSAPPSPGPDALPPDAGAAEEHQPA